MIPRFCHVVAAPAEFISLMEEKRLRLISENTQHATYGDVTEWLKVITQDRTLRNKVYYHHVIPVGCRRTIWHLHENIVEMQFHLRFEASTASLFLCMELDSWGRIYRDYEIDHTHLTVR